MGPEEKTKTKQTNNHTRPNADLGRDPPATSDPEPVDAQGGAGRQGAQHKPLAPGTLMVSWAARRGGPPDTVGPTETTPGDDPKGSTHVPHAR